MPLTRIQLACITCLLSTSAHAGPLPDVLPTGGINIADYNYYDLGSPFIDYAKMSHEWLSSDGQVWSDDRPIELTPLGYPAALAQDQIARSVMFTHNGGVYNTGQYDVTWDGTGKVRLSSAYGSLEPLEFGDNDASYQVISTSEIGLLLEIWATDTSDPVRNIRVIEDQYQQQASPFHPSFVRDLQDYGVLRFMDWLPTNGNGITDWSDRSLLDQAHWGKRQGVPYEMQIALGNELQQDIWLTIPHAATDDYITQLAQLVSEQLDPNLRVWIEYTNEAWNGSFLQSDYVRDVLTERYDTTFAAEAYAYRAGEVFDVAAQVLPPERLIRVVGGWAQTPFVLRKGLPVLTGEQGETNADVAAIATYFSLTSDQLDQVYADYLDGQVDFDQVFVDLRANIDEASQTWQANRAIAEAYGLPLVSYEGGQHIVPWDAGQRNDAGFTQLLFEIQRDPRMGEMYTHLTEKWREIGGSTLTLFTNMDPWSKSGAWGLKEGFDDPVAPKFDSVQAYLTGNPGGWDLRTGYWLGDVNGDGSLDVADLDLLAVALTQGESDDSLDLNRDGLVNQDDHRFWVLTLKQTYPGDTNLDGLVETTDLVTVFERGVYEDGIPQNASWESGDWNGDREFDTSDLIAMMESGALSQYSATARVVPEPAGSGIFALIFAGLFSRVRRRKGGGHWGRDITP